MVNHDGRGAPFDLVAAVAARTGAIVQALGACDEEALRSASELPGWSRLTIACHLRYGAEALCRMTRGAVAGEAVSYYPEGRERQRPLTLSPAQNESPHDVVASLARHSEQLHEVWSELTDDVWELDVVEPKDNRDLGRLPLGRLPLLRLTEVEVHGSDLALGLDDWSDRFVSSALTFRLEWLNTRRSNHRAVDGRVQGSWLLVASDGPTYRVTVSGDAVDSRPASPASPATAEIAATSRDLLALLLGRPVRTPLRFSGDVGFGQAFTRAFPGP
jgi:maleylpyruvate isomerase